MEVNVPNCGINVLNIAGSFFNAVAANGFYKLREAAGSNPTPTEYRYAYRMGYILLDSPEVLHSVRVAGYDVRAGRLLIYGVLGVTMDVTLILRPKSMLRCFLGQTEPRLTGMRRKQKAG